MRAQVLLFYKYWDVDDVDSLVEWQRHLCIRLGLKGRIHCAAEGINGTVGGSLKSCQEYIEECKSHLLFGNMFKDCAFKTSHSERGADEFPMLYVIKVHEIIRIGIDTDSLSYKDAGYHLNPSEFHERLISPEFWKEGGLVLDVRNLYESEIGRFHGATRVPSRTFDEFPKFVDKIVEQQPKIVDNEILMYCTGGIRCERASAFLKQRGFKKVSQLQGGIHAYCEAMGSDSLFQGKNFVFDRRLATDRVGNTIVGRCITCKEHFDTYSRSNKCPGCNSLVLLCENCSPHRQNLHARLFCSYCLSEGNGLRIS